MFEVGKIYHRRTDIHAKYGGQEQSGISTPSKFPYIFLFSGENGANHGYEDGWIDADTYRYTGQGQRGDMEFRAGNKAIRDHAENDEEIHLFERTRNGFYEYMGELEYVSHELVQRSLDTDNRLRAAIVFTLRRMVQSTTPD